MRRFFLFSIGYLCVAIAFLFLFRENPGYQLFEAVRRTGKMMINFVHYLPYIIGGVAILMIAARRMFGKAVLAEMGWALAFCFVFSASFAFIKTSIPYIIPFYADPFFADLDKALHGGVDPWVLAHYLQGYINPSAVSFLYFEIWGPPAVFFPFLLAAIESDAARKTRFMLLYLFVWIGLGNVVAFAGSSVGPIYYDKLHGTDRFADLLIALETSGIGETRIGGVQSVLWQIYSEFGQVLGSGISAFPSVHNGVAALVMIYLWERSKWLAPIGVSFCAAILFASVYVGWHYAIDGYASIILVVAAWHALRKIPALSSTQSVNTPREPELKGAMPKPVLPNPVQPA